MYCYTFALSLDNGYKHLVELYFWIVLLEAHLWSPLYDFLIPTDNATQGFTYKYKGDNLPKISWPTFSVTGAEMNPIKIAATPRTRKWTWALASSKFELKLELIYYGVFGISLLIYTY